MPIRATRRQSADGEEIDHEHEGLVRCDHTAGTGFAVAHRGRNRETTAAADLHALHTVVPTLDDLASPQSELERLHPIPRRVELLTGRPRHADVVHRDVLAGHRLVAVADRLVLDQEIGGWRSVGNRDIRLTHARRGYLRVPAIG